MDNIKKIWTIDADLESLNASNQNTLVHNLGITFTAIGPDWLEAKMPVDDRTVQPYRLLHGGASAALSETLGSVASVLCINDLSKFMPVGVELNANHLRSARSGFVTGRVSPIRIGRKLHVWNTDIRDEDDKLVCVSRLTVMVVERL